MSEPVRKFNLRLPEPLYERLRAEAEIEKTSVNKLVVSLLDAITDFAVRQPACDHEPFKSSGYRRCYRCGSPL